jgi:hypothetical protein
VMPACVPLASFACSVMLIKSVHTA